MKQTFYGFFLILLSVGIYSCNCFNTKCDTCPPYSYSGTSIYYYDPIFVGKNDFKKIYIYELDQLGNTIHFDSINNENLDHQNYWNKVNFKPFYRLTHQNAATKVFIATLKDSTFPVRIENIIIGFKDGGKECCSCDDY